MRSSPNDEELGLKKKPLPTCSTCGTLGPGVGLTLGLREGDVDFVRTMDKVIDGMAGGEKDTPEEGFCDGLDDGEGEAVGTTVSDAVGVREGAGV